MKHSRRSLVLLGAALCLAPGCYCADILGQYDSERAVAVLGANVAADLPLVLSAPGDNTLPIGIEVHGVDCSGGQFDASFRLLRRDGTAIDSGEQITARSTLTCGSTPARLALAASELVCFGERCDGTFTVELTSSTSVGPREVEVRLVAHETGRGQQCTNGLGGTARIDSFGE